MNKQSCPDPIIRALYYICLFPSSWPPQNDREVLREVGRAVDICKHEKQVPRSANNIKKVLIEELSRWA